MRVLALSTWLLATGAEVVQQICINNQGGYLLKLHSGSYTSEVFPIFQTRCVTGLQLSLSDGDAMQVRAEAIAGPTKDCFRGEVYDSASLQSAHYDCTGSTLSMKCVYSGTDGPPTPPTPPPPPSPPRPVTEAGVELIVTSSPGPTKRSCYATPGLPSWTQGDYLVSGPAQFEIGKYKFKAIFDGIGMTNRFELLDKEICFTSVWLESDYRNQTLKWECPAMVMFEGTTPPRSPMCLNMAKLDNDWVNAINVGNEVMMLTDSAAMLRIDLDTLAYLGEKQWVNDSIPTRVGSAHPVLRPGTQTWVGVAAEMGLTSDKNHMEYFTFEGDVAGLQPRPVMGKTGNLKHPPFMHSYGVTPNYVVMPLDLGMGLGENCSSVGLLCGMVAQWQGIHVVDNNGVVTVFDTEPFYHVHVVNAFENATGVTLDVGAYHQAPFAATGALDIDLYLNKTTRDANPIRATMRRVHMHFSGPLAGKTTYQTFKKIPGSHSDFFRLNPNHIGLPYCYYYATQWWHDSSNYANMAIMKHDLCTDTTSYWSATDHYVGEPFFIPDPAGMHEDDGVLVFVALDGPNRRSKFMTLDAKTMQEVNGTAVHLDTHIPFTAHGTFFSDVLNPKSVRAIVV